MDFTNRYRLAGFLILLTMAIFLTECRDQNVNTEPDAALTIYSVSPLFGKSGSEVLLTGTNFSQNPAGNKVTFNGVSAQVMDASSSVMTVIVPERARSGQVEVVVNGSSTTGPAFTYIPTIEVSTYAGTGDLGFTDGRAENARFIDPVGLELSDDGTLYVADYGNHSIRAISPGGEVVTLAGNGIPGMRDEIGRDARFNNPIDLEVDNEGTVYVSDFRNHRIRKISPTGNVTTLSGNDAGNRDGDPESALFYYPAGMVLHNENTLYVSDSGNNSIRAFYLDDRVETIAGDGTYGFVNGYASEARFRFPFGLDTGRDENLIVSDHSNHRIRHVSSEQFVSNLAGNGNCGFADGPGEEARLHSPYDVAVDDQGVIYVADYQNHSIRMVTLSGHILTLAGAKNDHVQCMSDEGEGEAGFVDGDETEARFNHPIGLAVNGEGTVLYVADHHNQVIRKITMK